MSLMGLYYVESGTHSMRLDCKDNDDALGGGFDNVRDMKIMAAETGGWTATATS